MKRTVRSLNPSRISRISRTSRTFRQRKTVSPAERIPAPASQEAGVTEQSQDVSTTQNTETGGTQGTQGESTTQKPDTAAIQETQSAAPQEVHQDDNDNGSNGSGISDDGEPWQTVDADPANFNNLLRRYNMENVVVEDIFTLEQFDYLKKNNTYGIIVAHHNPVSNPPRSQLPSHGSERLFFRGNRPVNASVTQSLVTILANSDATLGNDINTYMMLSDSRGNDRVLKRMHNSLPVLPEANLNPDEANEEQGNNNQAGDLYHYVSYIFFDGCIWQLDCQKMYPSRRDFVPHNDSWINTLKKMLVAEHGNNPFNTTFLAVMENPKFELKNKYNAIQRFDRTIANRLGTGSTRDATEVLSQLHLNRVRTRLIAYLRNMVNADLKELVPQFLEEYGPGLEEAPQATQAVRGKGHRKTTGGTRGGKVAAQSTGKRGASEGQSEGVSTRASKKRQRNTEDKSEEQRKKRVKTRYPLRK